MLNKKQKEEVAEYGSRIPYPYEANDPLRKPIEMNQSIIWAKDALKSPSECVIDVRSGRPVFHVRDFPTFIRAIGKVKFLRCSEVCSGNARNAGYEVVFRGQTFLGSDLLRPSYYRRPPNAPNILKKTEDELLDKQLSDLKKLLCKGKKKDFVENYDERVVEGLLQQYGNGSRWIDAVDNIWTALWFSCHNAFSDNCGVVHYERRNPVREKVGNRYCYILLLGSETTGMGNDGVPGLRHSKSHELLDLRYAVQSFYIRPHIQHGLLIRSLDRDGKPKHEMEDLIQSIIRVDLVNALEWLGSGASLSVSSMFPPPVVDSGYDALLRIQRSGRMRDDVGHKYLFPLYT